MCEDWSYYASGVFTTDCRSINHAVALVGYGVDENGWPFWKIRNSWSERWGENGDMRIYRFENSDY